MTGIKTKEQMWSRLADRREDAVKLCSELIGFPSVNPPGDTRNVADYICRFIEKLQPSLIDHIKVIEPALGCRGLLVAIDSGRPGSTVTLNVTESLKFGRRSPFASFTITMVNPPLPPLVPPRVHLGSSPASSGVGCGARVRSIHSVAVRPTPTISTGSARTSPQAGMELSPR